jgi:hypothetical protein
MKSFMIFWAIVGFFIGIGFSLESNCSWSTAFWRACTAALVAGIIARWWGNVWIEGLRDSIKQRQYRKTIPAPAKIKTTAKT